LSRRLNKEHNRTDGASTSMACNPEIYTSESGDAMQADHVSSRQHTSCELWMTLCEQMGNYE